MSGEVLVTASKLDLHELSGHPYCCTQQCLLIAGESRATAEDSKDSCLGIETQAMELTIKSFPLKIVNIPWRNNNLSILHTDPPLSEQGETIIGVYLLVLGKSPVIYRNIIRCAE